MPGLPPARVSVTAFHHTASSSAFPFGLQYDIPLVYDLNDLLDIVHLFEKIQVLEDLQVTHHDFLLGLWDRPGPGASLDPLQGEPPRHHQDETGGGKRRKRSQGNAEK